MIIAPQLIAYCILSLGALGHFGSKHRDQFLLRFYAFFAVYWALFMGVRPDSPFSTLLPVSSNQIATHSCLSNQVAVVGGISTLAFNKPTESEIADCDRDPACDHDEFHREKTHPIAGGADSADELLFPMPPTILNILNF